MEYKVKAGDGWYRIAKNLGVDVNDLLKVNNATLKTVIHPGQILKTSRPVGLGQYVQGLSKKEEKPKTMPTPYKSGYTEQQFIRDNARSIQQQLVNAGYDLGKYGENKDGVDGKWGKTSQAALNKALSEGYRLDRGKLVNSEKDSAKSTAVTYNPFIPAGYQAGAVRHLQEQTAQVKPKEESKKSSSQSAKVVGSANTFVPMGAQAMVQKAQKQATSQPQLQTTGSAFYISYPKHPISTGGTPLKYITPTLPLGHSASIIMDENGNATYHTYGRYGDRGSYITTALPSMRKGESKQAYLERIRPHLEYADKNEPVKATYVSKVDSKKSRQYYKDEPQKGNYGFIIGSTCVGEACNGINAGRNFSKGELFQYITPNTPDLQHTLYGNETYHF